MHKNKKKSTGGQMQNGKNKRRSRASAAKPKKRKAPIKFKGRTEIA